MLVNGYRPLAIHRRHLRRLERLPLLHRDRFDRLLIAQALEKELVSGTVDQQIRAYDASVYW